MERTILVTGATGNLGRDVVKQLHAKGFLIRAATRDVSKIAREEGITPVAFDFDDPNTFDVALTRVASVFLIAPPLDPRAAEKLNPFIDRAKEVGVNYIVFNSYLGADRNDQSPLRAVERHVIGSGLDYTILRPNFFMENFATGYLAPMIQQQDGIFLAAGDAKTSFISTRDIARVTAVAFLQRLTGEEYNLTGREALDHAQVAAKISKVAGRTITYHPVDEEAMLQGAREQGMPEASVPYLAELYRLVRAGHMAVVTDDIKEVTKRKPITFDEFAVPYADCWKQYVRL
jgi:uncharacterized protein YbjT (DUF2867 family)